MAAQAILHLMLTLHFYLINISVDITLPNIGIQFAVMSVLHTCMNTIRLENR